MTEPVIYVPVREALTRMEADLRQVRADLHTIQLQLASSSATAVAEVADDAVARARLAMWVAGLSGPVASVLTFWLTRH